MAIFGKIGCFDWVPGWPEPYVPRLCGFVPHAVAVIDPMRRGLKRESDGGWQAIGDVAVIDPLRRGQYTTPTQ